MASKHTVKRALATVLVVGAALCLFSVFHSPPPSSSESDRAKNSSTPRESVAGATDTALPNSFKEEEKEQGADNAGGSSALRSRRLADADGTDLLTPATDAAAPTKPPEKLSAASSSADAHWLEWPDGRRGLRFELEQYDIEEKDAGNGRFSRVSAPRTSILKTPDGPALPVRRLNIILENGAEGNATLADGEYREIHVGPPEAALGFVSRGDTDRTPPQPAERPSAGRGLVPDSVIRMTEPFNLREVRGRGVLIHPFQYDYERGVLRVWTRIDIAVDGAAEVESVPVLPSAFTEFADAHFVAPLSASARGTTSTTVSVSTEEDTDEEDSAKSASSDDSTRGETESPGHLLVVAADELVDALDEFVEWKRQRGFETTVLKYPGDTGAGAEALGTGIQSAYDRNGITHIMLLGDSDLIPVHSSDDNPTDIRYALLDGDDLVRDAFISRTSADTLASATRQLSKFFTYEKHPESDGQWYSQATFIGSNEGENKSGSVLGLDDWEILDQERESFLEYGYTRVDRMYDYDADNPDPFPGDSPDPQDILSAWNEGRGILYYLGHGTESKWVTGSLYSADVRQGLTNRARTPFILDVACLNGDFTWSSSDCIAEVMMDPGEDADGAAGMVAATEDMDWDPPVIMLREFTTQLTAGELLTAGALHTYAVQSAMQWCESTAGLGAIAAEKIMEQAHLFGDPTLGIRTREPTSITLTHDPAVLMRSEPFAVTVTNTNSDEPVAGAEICLYHASGIQTTARTDSAGQATLTVEDDLTQIDSLLLTVYAANLNPVQQTVEINAGPLRFADFAMAPALTGFPYENAIPVLGGTPPYEWTLDEALPTGLSLDADTGQISGTATEPGEWDRTVTVTDAAGATVQTVIHLGIDDPVRIVSETLPDAQVDTAYDVQPAVEDGFSPQAWQVLSGDLPPGLSLSESGSLSGTPSRAGEYTFTLGVQCAAGSVDQATYTLTVASNPTLTIADSAPPDADPQAEYSHSFRASGGSGGGYSWRLVDGILPGGVDLHPDGTLSGIPEQDGTYEFTVQVQDDSTPALSATRKTSLHVQSPVRILTDSLPDAQLGAPYEAALELTGSYTPFELALSPTDATISDAESSNFADIAAEFATDTAQEHWADDETEWTVALNFDFPYFGRDYRDIRIGDNGYLVLGDSSPNPMWEATADQLSQHRIIAPFWTDLRFTTDPADGVFLNTTADSATILWRGSDYHYEDDRSEFAVTLHADGRIVFHYGDITTTNRVVVGYSDTTERNTQALFTHTWDAQNPVPVEGWAQHADIRIQPPDYPPDWLSLSDTGALRGTPAQSGVFPFRVTVADSAGYSDSVQMELSVLRTSPADTNTDGDVDNSEILAFIERCKHGDVTRSQVETAVAVWRDGPPESRRTTTESTPSEMTSTRRVQPKQQAVSPAIERARSVRAGTYEQSATRTSADGAYSSPADIDAELRELADRHPNICRYNRIGTSQSGRPIGALLISDQPDATEIEPTTALVGAMHGDEPIAAQLPLEIAGILASEYANDASIRAIVDTTRIWVLPCLNPDGLANGARNLPDNRDLNRIFPDGTDTPLETPWHQAVPLQQDSPEATAVMDWAARHQPTALLSFHSGATVVCYPFGNSPSGNDENTPTSDDDLFRQLASDYADQSTYIAGESPFPDGIVNGADWYAVAGEMTDWLYRTTGTLAMTVELTDIKAPPYAEVVDYRDWNRPAVLAFLNSMRNTVRGRVRSSTGNAPLSARISVADRSQAVFTDPFGGGFHRLLPPGTHTLTAEAFGHQTATRTATVPENTAPERVDISLERAPQLAVRRFEQPNFEPGTSLTTQIDLYLDTASPKPAAVIIRETIPDLWSYTPNSTTTGRDSAGPGEPRVDNRSCAWLLWGEAVQDAAFRFDWDIPADSPQTTLFDGTLITSSMETPLLGVNKLKDQPPTESGFHLRRGWNLISLDLQPAKPSPTDIFAGHPGPVSVWSYENGHYIRPAAMEPGRGYWVYSTADRTVRYDGSFESNALRTLQPGWNLVGPLASRDAFQNRADVTSVLSWNLQDYQTNSHVESGRGYWIFMDTDGVLSLR